MSNNYLGQNLQLIMKRLFNNQNLLKLLLYTDKTPYEHMDLTKEEIQNKIYQKLIYIIPYIPEDNLENSVLSIVVDSATNIDANIDYNYIDIELHLFIPYTQWIIKDVNLRPFLIIEEINNSLKNKNIEGLGKMTGGSFRFNYGDDKIVNYIISYRIISNDK